MTLGTRVAVMRAGTVQQVDTPQALYRSLANLFVAAFIGSPSMNSVEVELAEGERATLIATDRRALFTAEVSEGTVVRPGQRITLGLDTSRLHFFDLETAESLRRPLAAAVG
jgi:multiple sugar transport system ATP-binding protein